LAALTRLLVLIPPHEIPDGFIAAIIEHARASGAEVKALYVVDKLWFNYSGGDWLSGGASRAGFDKYMRETLRAEGDSFIERLSRAVEDAGLAFSSGIVEGDPAEFALKSASESAPDTLMTVAGFPGLGALRKKYTGMLIIYKKNPVPA